MSNTKLQITIPDRTMGNLNKLQEKIGVEGLSQLVNISISLLDEIVRNLQEGSEVRYVTVSGDEVTLIFPFDVKPASPDVPANNASHIRPFNLQVIPGGKAD